MAVYSVGLNDPQARKFWSRTLDAVAIHKTAVGKFTGPGPNSIVQSRDELSKNAGDRIRFSLRLPTTGPGRVNDEVLEGYETTLQITEFDLYIGMLRQATKVPYQNMTDQRVPYNLRLEAKLGLEDWAVDRHDSTFFNHLCGNTAINSDAAADAYRGFNTVVAYDANHMVFPNAITETESLTSSDPLSLAVIDKAVERAKTLDIPLRTVSVNGQPCFVCFVHPYQVTSLRTEDSDWWTQMRAALQGGMVKDNPLLTGALGIYNGVLFIEDNRVTNGVDSGTDATVADTKVAVLAGAQACVQGYGRFRDRLDGKFNWVEEWKDYRNSVGVSASFIFGFARTIYDGETYGSIAIPTYATAA